MRLGRTELKQIGPVSEPTVFYDDELKGFGLRVMPPSARSAVGTRSWFVEYRPGSGGRRVAKRRLVIGRVDTLSPEKARQSAKGILAAARLGGDPAALRAQARSARSIAELRAQYLAETNVLRKPRTIELYEGLWNRYIVPELGAIRLLDLTRSDVLGLHRRVGAKHRSTANRIVILLSHFYAWAQERSEAPGGDNPARGIAKFKEQGRERYLTSVEMRRLGDAIREAETVGIEWLPDPRKAKSKHAPKRADARLVTLSPFAAGALRLLLLTGARLREILNLEWSQVDFERGMLFLPDSKTGRKVIVLGDAAIQVLAGLRDAHESHLAVGGKPDEAPRVAKYVILGDDLNKPRADLKRPWKLVRTRAGLEEVRLHDLRHSYASVGAGAGMGLPLIGKLLGHADPGTTQRYAHLDADPVRRASDLISSHIAASLGEGLDHGHR